MTTYYLTKYATTTGKIEAREAEKIYDDGYVRIKGYWTSFKSGRDAFTDPDEAKAAVRAARDKKILSLEKQIAKLRKVEPVIQ